MQQSSNGVLRTGASVDRAIHELHIGTEVQYMYHISELSTQLILIDYCSALLFGYYRYFRVLASMLAGCARKSGDPCEWVRFALEYTIRRKRTSCHVIAVSLPACVLSGSIQVFLCSSPLLTVQWASSSYNPQMSDLYITVLLLYWLNRVP